MITITPLPVPTNVQTSLPTQTMANVLPAVAGQATPPITANAVKPSPASGRGQKTRGSREKTKDESATDGEKRGKNVNISI